MSCYSGDRYRREPSWAYDPYGEEEDDLDPPHPDDSREPRWIGGFLERPLYLGKGEKVRRYNPNREQLNLTTLSSLRRGDEVIRCLGLQLISPYLRVTHELLEDSAGEVYVLAVQA